MLAAGFSFSQAITPNKTQRQLVAALLSFAALAQHRRQIAYYFAPHYHLPIQTGLPV
jgi:hypothetical protein